LVAITNELFIASLDQGGAPMMGAFLVIGIVGALVYLVRSRRRSDGDDTSDRSRKE
jgi:hypothetical protein